MFAFPSGAEAGRFRDRTSDPGTAVDDDGDDYDDDNIDNDKDNGNTRKWIPHKKLRVAPPNKHAQPPPGPSSSSGTMIAPARLDLAFISNHHEAAGNDDEHFPDEQRMFSEDSENPWEDVVYIIQKATLIKQRTTSTNSAVIYKHGHNLDANLCNMGN